ncbi:MAG: tetratricopeptide repeat protein [Planctomycetes bacterium]|nr:tetratricopeptide repeat protein [Planctomycetota bacterium]
MPRPSALTLLPSAALVLLATACGPSSPEKPGTQVAAASTTPVAPAPPATVPQLPRPTDPLYRSIASAIERGDNAQARRDLLKLAPGLHASLLNARLLALEGDAIGAVREIEAAREKHPGQAAVYAAAAEIHAAGARLTSAEDELREGLALAGECAELWRARGVLALCREGGASIGLAHLLRARQLEPELEFSTHVLAEAHRLLGAAALGAKDPLQAAASARAALALEPDEHDALQLLADALAAQGDFDGALEQYERLLARGAEVRAACLLMYTRGATAALIQGRREVALARCLRARELGASDEELGFGAELLRAEVDKHIDAGLAAYERGEHEQAVECFDKALRVDPQSLEALNHHAVASFRLARYEAAANGWRKVLELAQRTQVELPEPTHLNLARALYQLDRKDEVRTLLEGWLAAHPHSEHAAATRQMLARL